MEDFNRRDHWERIYRKSQPDEVSWYQATPETSLKIIQEAELPLTARIIDVGGGDSLLVDHLLELGYKNVTVLDISEAAIGRAKQRLGSRAGKVIWVVADAAGFKSEGLYDFWHDRAAFHFFTEDGEIDRYLNTAYRSISPGGILVLGTFSDKGPEKCSGLPVRRYSEEEMAGRVKKHFKKNRCFTIDHITPSGNVQNFIFCSFIRLPED